METILISAAITLASLALVAFIMYRRFSTRKVAQGKLFILPLVMAVVAVIQGDLIDTDHRLVSESLLAAGIVLALGLGAGLGNTMRLWRDSDGTLWSKGSKLTVVMLVATIGVRIGLVAAGYGLGTATGIGAILLFVAAWLLAQNAVIAWRVRTLPAASVSVSA